MTTKKELLKELGWNDELISHYILEGSVYREEEEPESQVEVYESNSLVFNYDAQVSGQYVINKGNK